MTDSHLQNCNAHNSQNYLDSRRCHLYMNIICTNIVVFTLVEEKDIAHTFKYKQNPSPIACPRQDFLGHSNAQVNELIVSNFTTLWSLCGLSPTLCVRKIWLGLRSNPLETLKTTTIRCARNRFVPQHTLRGVPFNCLFHVESYVSCIRTKPLSQLR